MPTKRKRHRPKAETDEANSHRTLSNYSNVAVNVVRQSVLSQFYPKVLTLREYLLFKLPNNSRIRRKKVVCAGRQSLKQLHDCAERKIDNEGGVLGSFLDTTLVGIPRQTEQSDHRTSRWRSFTSWADASDLAGTGTPNGQGYSQSEIVDFAIWLLCNKSTRRGNLVKHILCQGYNKVPSINRVDNESKTCLPINGIIPVYPNKHSDDMKADPWPQVLHLLGKGGDRVMIDLMVDCGIFLAVANGYGNYYQISGEPLGDLVVLEQGGQRDLDDATTRTQLTPIRDRSPSSIVFLRNKTLYARPMLTSTGAVTFGLRHIHVLNRYPYTSETIPKGGEQVGNVSDVDKMGAFTISPNTVQVLKYIFPRQFGLHNVFNSVVDFRETAYSFKDYTLREDEIRRLPPNHKGASTSKVPKRLRGLAVNLVRKLQILHQRCPYDLMIKYYCSSNGPTTFPTSQLQPSIDDISRKFQTQQESQGSYGGSVNTTMSLQKDHKRLSVTDLASPTANVSAFCRAVVCKVVPNEFWGIGEDQLHNRKVLLENVDRFINLRRFETLTLHDVVQRMKIATIPWLNGSNSSVSKRSQSDTSKKWEIFCEFMYYIFDSLIIPLIRCNFHVTESGIHRYRLFYFRQDVWRNLADPAMASLKQAMFEEVDIKIAQQVLESCTIGFSHVRLLPKEKGVRPILNLRRRQVQRGSKKALRPSINSTLAPVYNMLTFEKGRSPEKFGSTLFSVGELYNRLKEYAGVIEPGNHPLYFCKVDVQSAFDTIPQATIVKLISELPNSNEYQITKHVEIKPGDGYRLDMASHGRSKPIRKWTSLAWAANDCQSFDLKLCPKMAHAKNTVFTKNSAVQNHSKEQLLALLSEHVQRNLVKIGKKYYRQKNGIPQGSVLSSLLCNYFYANLEVQHLSFLKPKSSLLLRLIDDFLLITIDPDHARQFIQTMHDGLPDYGVSVNPEKSLVNFEISINGHKVRRLVKGHDFPYCGTFINTNTLSISKDRERSRNLAILDSLTVEFSKTPGKTFHRKVLNSFKIQCHAMFLDTSYNSPSVVARNVYESFVESATKMCAYAKCLPTQKQPSAAISIQTIIGLIDLAFLLIKSKERSPKNPEYRCAISKAEIEWLALQAFLSVLNTRQSKYRQVLQWLRDRLQELIGGKDKIFLQGFHLS